MVITKYFNKISSILGIVLLMTTSIQAQDDTFTLTSNSTYVVDGVIKSVVIDDKYKKIIIPEFLDGQYVTGIDDDVFENRGLEEVQFPSTLKMIYNHAFINNNLKTVVLPESLEYIGRYAFVNNPDFEAVYPTSDSPDFIGWYDSYTGITHVGEDKIENLTSTKYKRSYYTLTDDDVIMEEDTLVGLTITPNFKDIIIPEYLQNHPVKSIKAYNSGNTGFYDKDIFSIQFPKQLEVIGRYEFAKNLISEVKLPENVIAIEFSSFYTNKLVTFEFNDGLQVIGESCLSNNPYLQKMDIPNSVIRIEKKAFWGAEFKEITLPIVDDENFIDWGKYKGGETVHYTNYNDTYIAKFKYTPTDDDVIVRNDTLISISYPDNVSQIILNENLDGQTLRYIETKKSNQRFYHLKKIQLPATLEYIGDNAFSGNQLEEITIPDQVHYIGREAFYSNQLTSIKLPSQVDTIYAKTFAFNELTSITLPGNIKYIDEEAFYSNNIQDIAFSDGLEYIGYRSFMYNELNTVTFPNSLRTVREYAFTENPDVTLTFPKIDDPNFIGWFNESTKSQLASNTTKETNDKYSVIFKKIIDENEIITDEEMNIIDVKLDFSKYKHLEFPNKIDNKSIKGIRCDLSSKGLVGVTLPSDLEYIGHGVFTNNAIQNLTLPSKVKVIGTSAFMNNRIAEITLPDELDSLHNSAFQENDLSSIEIPSGIMYIGDRAFSSNQFSYYTVPKNSNPGFKYWYSQTSTAIEEGAQVYTYYPLYAKIAYQLTSNDITVKDGYITACSYKGDLKIIDIPAQINGEVIKGIADKPYESGVFGQLDLQEVFFDSNLKYIGDFAFENNKIDNLNFQEGLHHIGKGAFIENQLNPFYLKLPFSIRMIQASAFAGNPDFSYFNLPRDPDDYYNSVEWKDKSDQRFYSGYQVYNLFSYYTTDLSYSEKDKDEVITSTDELDHMLVFPTLFQESVQVINYPPNAKYFLFTTDGKLIQQGNVSPSINIQSSKGMYILKIGSGEDEKSFKLIKQ
ncbi:leucine-rich repeat protein [Flammeovirga agarivorans]|uniref:Leucine-rich repeat protein n=1 Tax=Flammeovirga agarivorans TaxID=2726742 RepID=A0A7X8SQB9_9BACT|nr:leucine-rich repeat protein [Flammeovirga agarivorans]NLR94343.1 leucine-rich repeat protein [Flammeovirga agarivorans]